MSDWIDTRTRIWAALAVIGGVALFLGLEISEEPMTPLEMVLELLNIIPGVIVGVGVVLPSASAIASARNNWHCFEISKWRACRGNAGERSRAR